MKLAARCEGFSLEAGRHLHEHDRKGLEALQRYCLRPSVAQGLVSQSSEDHGEVVLQLKRPMADGQTTLRMAPLELLRRLAGLVPPPRVHHAHYFGGFASHSRLHSWIVPRSPKVRRRCRMDAACSEQLKLPLRAQVFPGSDESETLPLVKAPAPRARDLDWRALLSRTFATELFDCACGGRRSVVAFVTDRAKAAEILEKLGLPAEPPRTARARAPPVQGDWVDRVVGLEGVRAQIAMLQTPDGHGRIELSKFFAPSNDRGDQRASANAFGLRHVAFAVDDLDAVLARLQARGVELVGGPVRYEDTYRLCYVRGPEGIIVELAEELG